MSQDTFQPPGATDAILGKGQAVEALGSQSTVVSLQGGGGTKVLSPGRGVGGGGGGGVGSFVGGAGSITPMKSVISLQSKRLAEDVNSVYDRQIMFTTKIQFQRSRIEDLMFRISKAEKELEDKRRNVGPDIMTQSNGGASSTEREIHKIENRLQQTLTKASMLDAANARRKECVNSLRREKMAEMKAKKRLQAELEQARATCASTTKTSQQMVDEKEKTRREIELLKQEVVKDLEAFRGEFQGMAESLAAAREATQGSNAKLENMARNRTTPGPETADPADVCSGGGGGGAGGAGAGTGDGDARVGGKAGAAAGGGIQPLSRARRLRQQSNMSFWLILKKKNDLQAKAARVQELRAMLEKISAATSLATLDDFVPVMLEAEDENYNLFKLINELNRELEELDQEKSLVNEDIDHLTQAGNKRDQQAVKLSLQQQIDRSRATAEVYDQAYSRDVDVIKSIEESLISVFNKVGSSDKAVAKQLTAMGVTDRNILLFLSQMEDQIEHIVQVYNAATDSNSISNVRRPTTPVVAVNMKEQILRMSQGTNKGGPSTAAKGPKMHRSGSLSGQTNRTKTVGLPPEKATSGSLGGTAESSQDSIVGVGGGGFPQHGSGST